MKKKKRFVPSHFGRPLGGFMGLGIPPLPPAAAKQGQGIRAIREQTNKVIEGLRKVRGSDSRRLLETFNATAPFLSFQLIETRNSGVNVSIFCST